MKEAQDKSEQRNINSERQKDGEDRDTAQQSTQDDGSSYFFSKEIGEADDL